MYPIFNRKHPELYQHLVDAELGTIFALPWLITWFGHVLPDYGDVVRLYDFFLAQPPMMPVYMAAAIVLYREKEILATGNLNKKPGTKGEAYNGIGGNSELLKHIMRTRPSVRSPSYMSYKVLRIVFLLCKLNKKLYIANYKNEALNVFKKYIRSMILIKF